MIARDCIPAWILALSDFRLCERIENLRFLMSHEMASFPWGQTRRLETLDAMEDEASYRGLSIDIPGPVQPVADAMETRTVSRMIYRCNGVEFDTEDGALEHRFRLIRDMRFEHHIPVDMSDAYPITQGFRVTPIEPPLLSFVQIKAALVPSNRDTLLRDPPAERKTYKPRTIKRRIIP